MRESIGTISLLNFVIVFIFIIFAFFMGTFSYYKAYKVNNYMVAAIEKYEGFNDLSKKEITDKLTSIGYEFIDVDCPTSIKNSSNQDGYLVNPGSTAHVSTASYDGYCVYMIENDTTYKSHGNSSALATTDQYDTYEVTTYITFHIPVLNDVLKLRVTSKTGRIFYFN